MSPNKRRSEITASELLQKLAANEDYQARLKAKETRIETRAARESLAEQPILEDLRRAGVEVGSVWDFVNTSNPYPEALPILLQHFERGGYPDTVMESLGRALAVRPAVHFWDRLRERYLRARGSGEKTGAAVALTACVTKAQLEDLVELVRDPTHGSTRIFFVDPILRQGDSRGREVVMELQNDPICAREARALLSHEGS